MPKVVVRPRLLITVSLALLLGACASGGGNTFGGSAVSVELSPLLDSSWRPAPGQRCAVSDLPTWAATPLAVFDGTEVTRVMRASDGPESVEPFAVLQVQFDSIGALSWTRVLESNLPESAQQALRGAVLPELPLAIRGREAGGRALVRIEGAETPAITAGGDEACNCAILNPERMRTLLSNQAGALRQSVPAQRYQMEFALLPQENGRVREVQTMRSSGRSDVDEAIGRVLFETDLAPPLLNRVLAGGAMCGYPVSLVLDGSD